MPEESERSVLDVLAGQRIMHLPGGHVQNGRQRDWLLYILGDGAYPRWPNFFFPHHAAATEKEKHVTMCQTSVRKDLRCFFGCLQGWFQILRWERHEWSDENIFLIAQVCIYCTK